MKFIGVKLQEQSQVSKSVGYFKQDPVAGEVAEMANCIGRRICSCL